MSLSLDIKRVFLSFAQQYFSTSQNKYVWNADARLTTIFIGDKFSAKSATLEKYPSIILSANSKRWGRTSIDQLSKFPGFGIDGTTKVRSDLVLGSVTYNCISVNPIEAEVIGSLLFEVLVGYKDQFRTNSINQLLDIQQGDTQQIRADTVGRAYLVPVTVYFSKQATITTGIDNFDLVVYTYIDKGFAELALQNIIGGSEYFDALVYSYSGQSVIFQSPPASGLAFTATYLDSVTLQNITDTFPVCDGIETVYELTSIPYCYNEMLNHININYAVLD